MKKIPNADIQLSPITLGTMTYGSPVAFEDAVKLTQYAVGQGINHIDTANMYEGYNRYAGSAGGVAEEIVGKALKGLRRLDTDYIDLYYLHKPDPSCSYEEILTALQAQIQAGKIRYYGISNYSAEQLQQLLNCADAAGLPRPVICQPPLSLLKDGAREHLLPLCQREGIAVVPYQIYQGGLLTGKYRRGVALPTGSRAAEMPGWMMTMDDALYDKLEAYAAEADKQGITMAQYALRWVLDQPAVISALVGVKTTAQIDAALAAIK